MKIYRPKSVLEAMIVPEDLWCRVHRDFHLVKDFWVEEVIAVLEIAALFVWFVYCLAKGIIPMSF